MRFKIVSYDVLGNIEDGWEVNDVRGQGHVDLSLEDDDRAVLDALIGLGLLRAEASPVTVKVEWLDEFTCELYEALTGYPLYGLRLDE